MENNKFSVMQPTNVTIRREERKSYNNHGEHPTPVASRYSHRARVPSDVSSRNTPNSLFTHSLGGGLSWAPSCFQSCWSSCWSRPDEPTGATSHPFLNHGLSCLISQFILTYSLYIHADTFVSHLSRLTISLTEVRYLSPFLTAPIPFNLLRAIAYYLL